MPPVVLTGFQLMNKPVAIGAKDSPLETAIGETKTLTLSHKQSVFTFEFAALDYTAPAKNQYAYKLDGFDKEWREVGNQRTAVYTNLAPGRYTFHVKGSNNDGVWNEQGASLDVVIRPPFWASWWFRLLVLSAIGGAIYFVVHAARERRRGLEKMNAQLAEVAEKDRKAQQYLAGNVREMLRAMSRFSTGDLAVELDASSDDEIGQLRARLQRRRGEHPHDGRAGARHRDRDGRGEPAHPRQHRADGGRRRAADRAGGAGGHRGGADDDRGGRERAPHRRRRRDGAALGAGRTGGRPRRPRHLRQHGHDRLHRRHLGADGRPRSARAARRSRRSRA